MFPTITLPSLRPGFKTFVCLLLPWIAFDLFILRVREGVLHFDFWIYTLGLINTGLLLLWTLMVVRLHRLTTWASAIVFSQLFTIIIITNFFLYREFGEYITPHMIRFVADDPAYIGDYFSTYFGLGVGLCVLALVAGFTFLFLLGLGDPSALPQDDGRKLVLLIILLPIASLILTNQLRPLAKSKKLDALSSTLVSTHRFFRQDWTSKRLEASEREVPKPASDNGKYNVLVIVNESWDRTILPRFGGHTEIISNLSQRMSNMKTHEVFDFQRAFTNSGATDVSMPSLMTGVGPFEASQKLHSMPLLWDYGKSAKMRTAFVSSQRLSWNNLDKFFANKNLDTFITASELNAPAINDLGVDDLVSAQKVCELVKSHSRKKRSFIVYNSNAMHAPGQTSSPLLNKQPLYDIRQEKAAFILDAAMGKIFSCYEELGILKKTLIFVTADHGNGGLKPRFPRLYSFLDEALQIPFIVFIPKKLLNAHPKWRASLQANTSRNVSNMDLAPTIAQALGYLPMDLLGHSLLEEVSPSRTIIALNSNDIKKVDHEGFCIFKKNLRFITSTLYGTGLYHMETDPTQTRNLWTDMEDKDPIKRALLRIVEENFQLKRIYNRQD